MARPKHPESERSLAARLSVALNRVVTRDCIREWKEKGYPLDDIPALEKRLRNQERAPKKTPAPADPDQPPPPKDDDTPETLNIESELQKLQRKLVNAADYEDARTLRVQIAGVRDVLKSLREQGHYVTKESQIREGMATGQTIKALVLKIPAELPQQLVGLDYPDAVQKCEDYAFGILASLAESQEAIPV